MTVSAGQDDDASNDIATLTHTASGGDYGSVTSNLTVMTRTDDDTRGLVLSTATLAVSEGGNASYTVKLATQPTASVTMAISGHSGMDLTPDLTRLTLTTSDWNTTQTVTVSAGQDDGAAGDAATLTHTASGGEYASVTKFFVAVRPRGIIAVGPELASAAMPRSATSLLRMTPCRSTSSARSTHVGQAE